MSTAREIVRKVSTSCTVKTVGVDRKRLGHAGEVDRDRGGQQLDHLGEGVLQLDLEIGPAVLLQEPLGQEQGHQFALAELEERQAKLALA